MNEKCVFCNHERTGRWALFLSPPDAESRVIKHHVCPACYESLIKMEIVKP